MSVGSVGIISRLDSQIKLQMFAPFSGRHVGGAKSFIEHSGSILGSENLRNTFRRISGQSLGKRRDPELMQVSSLPISCKITISWVHPLISFRFLCVTMKTIYSIMYQSNRSFNISPPGIPRAFDVFSCPGGGNLINLIFPGAGIWSLLIGGGEFDR